MSDVSSHDRDLAAAAAAGDREAFAALYEAYVRKIYDYVYFRTHHRETAEDIVSHVFIKALENIGGFNPKRGVFAAWLYGIARNQIADHYRSRKTHASIEDAWEIADDAVNIPRDADTVLQADKIRAHMGKLSADQRDIVMLRLWQDLSFPEIAAITGKAEGACKMAYSRALKLLRAETLLLFFSLYFQ